MEICKTDTADSKINVYFSSQDDILEIIRGLIGRLGDMRDPDFMKTGLGISHHSLILTC